MNRNAPAFRIIVNPHTVDVAFASGRVRSYWCPSEGGYVREVTADRPGTLGQQVSYDLTHAGTMMTATREDLAERVRAGLRRAIATTRANESRQFGRTLTPAQALDIAGLA